MKTFRSFLYLTAVLIIRMWRTVKWLLSADCRFDDTVCRATFIAAITSAVFAVAICICQTSFRAGRPRPPNGSSGWHFRYIEDDGVAGHGWPLIAHTSEWRRPIDGGADYQWHPLAVAVDAAISVLVFASPILLAWRWLRSQHRFAFRLSTLLCAMTAIAMTLAFAEFEQEHSFEVLHWMHPALDCQQSGDRIEAPGRVPAVAGVACAIFALLTTICDAARSYHARIRSTPHRRRHDRFRE